MNITVSRFVQLALSANAAANIVADAGGWQYAPGAGKTLFAITRIGRADPQIEWDGRRIGSVFRAEPNTSRQRAPWMWTVTRSARYEALASTVTMNLGGS